MQVAARTVRKDSLGSVAAASFQRLSNINTEVKSHH